MQRPWQPITGWPHIPRLRYRDTEVANHISRKQTISHSCFNGAGQGSSPCSCLGSHRILALDVGHGCYPRKPAAEPLGIVGKRDGVLVVVCAIDPVLKVNHFYIDATTIQARQR